MELTTTPVTSTDTSHGGTCCGNCGGTPAGSSEAPTASAAQQTATQTYLVTGLTCEHCERAVTGELEALAGVSFVSVDLVPNGTSSVTVTSAQPLDRAQVAAALAEAGDYTLL